MKSFALVLLLAVSGILYADTARKPQTLVYSELVPATYRAAFVSEVVTVATRLQVKPDWLMIVIRFETAGTFRANVRNPYSGSVGLIQFIPTTATRLGTTPGKLSAMSAVEQLAYVEKYFAPYKGRMRDVYDVYLVVFAPAFLGKPDSQVLYRANGKTPLDRRRYNLNKVLDVNRDGLITIRDVKQQISRFVPAGS
ncbi:hypothetical protein GCM10028806_19640 [Spirosoma terrae]|uniref:Lytic transglycosylase domain-containing protein n=1 Tax=Spirosoma terrae TaxID=1968276 RepID=A0A6L9LD10_9BACT|nr:lytic transglycosylase domain-containing protein [Spirosoma terrae]NDU94719.1 lytic transglycosylase domain-containing protein [Spirosoma terrae]